MNILQRLQETLRGRQYLDEETCLAIVIIVLLALFGSIGGFVVDGALAPHLNGPELEDLN